MRKVKNINENWQFTKAKNAESSALPKSTETVSLPHTWNGIDGQDGGNDYYRGRCFYYKELSNADFPGGDRIFIEFCGANSSAEVYLNGERIASHDGGYSLWRAELTGKIKEKNLLAVAVDNSPSDSVYPQMADFTFYGGLYRDVNLLSVSDEHFCLEHFGGNGIMITPEIIGNDAKITVKAFVTNAKSGSRVKFTIKDGEDLVCESSVGSDSAECELTIDGVHLWNGISDPHLYTLEARLFDNDNEIDFVSAKFGCRSFSIDSEKGFILNGKPYSLHGVARHQDRPIIGNALNNCHHEEDIDLILEMGANTVRLAHYQHAQRFYDLCDEKGLVVWAEIPYISQHLKNGFDNTISHMKELITQNYNHPSIVVWGLSNEITMNGVKVPGLVENHIALNDLVHNIDKTRLTVEAIISTCPTDAKYTKIPDAIAYNHYFGWYGGDVSEYGPWFDSFHKKYPDRAIGLSEYGCEALNWHNSNPAQGDYSEEYQAYYHEECIKQLMDRPYIWATHVWNMFDFAADMRAEGGENGMNHKGLVTFDRKYKKDSFYAYKAWLSDEPFVHICGKRYVDRAEDTTKVTVYSNQNEVELFVNSKSFGKQMKNKYPFFYFNVPLESDITLKAKAGECEDTATIKKVENFNEKYEMKEEGAVINWFEIDTPAGYFSVNDKIGDILKAPGSWIYIFKVIKIVKKIIGGNEDKADKKDESDSAQGALNIKINRNTIKMAKGFTVKRAVSMASGRVTKEQILEINSMLNKVKKR